MERIPLTPRIFGRSTTLVILGLALTLGSGGLAQATETARPSDAPRTSVTAPIPPVLEPPRIISSPQNIRVLDHSTATFRAEARGYGFKYQWQVKKGDGAPWQSMAGRTGRIYQVMAARSIHGWQYRVVAGNAVGKVYSRAATLKVDPTRKYPLPAGGSVRRPDLRISVGLTDKNANAEVEAAADDNDPPRVGFRYISTRITLTNHGSKSSSPWWNLKPSFVGGDSHNYLDANVENPKRTPSISSIKPGESVTVIMFVEVPIKAISGGVWRIEKARGSYQHPAYFKVG